MNQGDNMLRSSALVAMGTGMSRITGLVRVAALTYALGRTALSDSYNLANIAPNLIYELLLGGVLSATLIPLFIDAQANDDNESPSVLLSVSLVALVVVSVVSLFGIHVVSWVIDTGGNEVRRRTIVALADLLVPQILFYGLTTIATAALNSRRIFAAPAFAPVLNNLVTTVVLVASAWTIGSRSSVLSVRLYDQPTVLLLGLGTTAGVASMSLVLLRPLRAAMADLHWDFRPRHYAVKAMVRLSGWTVGYVMANQIALAIVYALAIAHGAGTLTAYTTAFIFFQLPHGLFAVSIMTTQMPELSLAAAADDDAEFQRQFLEGARLMMLVIIPAAIGFILLAQPLIAILLQRGNFGGVDAEVTGHALGAFAIGLPGFSLYLYALRAFYARKDTRTPFVINAAENLLNVLLAFVLVASGSTGLALAYSVAYLAAAAGALVALHRTVGGFRRADVVATAAIFGRVVVACGAMALAVWAATAWIGSNHGLGALLRVAVGMVVGVGVFGVALHMLGVEEIDGLTRRLRRSASKVA